jgi:Polyketide cyclase / dehydrase and lipid transport.
MKLRSKITINAAPETIWALIAEPDLIAQWNPKLVAATPDGPKEAGFGHSYQFTFRMTKRESHCQATLTRFDHPKSLTWDYHGTTEQGTPWTVQDQFTLDAKGPSTRVSRCLDLSRAPLPGWAKPIVWLITTFGKPVDTPQLEELKRLAESL